MPKGEVFIPDEMKEVKKILLSVASYTSSLIDIGYGTGSDKATATVLVLASIFLSVASGYTTYSGLTQYTPSIISGLITLGVQGLLFGVSWRLGKLYIAGEISPAMWSIWAVTMLVSVFFSYSSLFSTVYSQDERKENRKISSITVVSSILRKLDDSLKSEFSDKKLKINNNDYLKWKKEIISITDKSKKYGEGELEVRLSEYKKLMEKYNREINYGGTKYINSIGKEVITKKGSGKIADGYKNDADNYKKYKLDTYEKTLEIILKKRRLIYNDILKFDETKDSEKLLSVYVNCINLIAEIEGKSFSCSLDLLGDSLTTLAEVKNRYNVFKLQCSNEIIEGSFDENIRNLRKCIRISRVPDDETEGYFKVIDRFQRSEGAHTHFFITIINELKRLNYLAIGTFILAIIMDLLILLCSLVASKHTTFLEITNGKDLLQMKNYPLDIILGTDININESDDEMIKRIKLILNNATFSLKHLDKKCSMIITMDKILELNMHKELGTFFAMGLARPVENNMVIAFRTNFILWMCEQISRHKQSTKSFSELHKAFLGDKNG